MNVLMVMDIIHMGRGKGGPYDEKGLNRLMHMGLSVHNIGKMVGIASTCSTFMFLILVLRERVRGGFSLCIMPQHAQN